MKKKRKEHPQGGLCGPPKRNERAHKVGPPGPGPQERKKPKSKKRSG